MRSARAHLPKPRKTIRADPSAMGGIIARSAALLEVRVLVGVGRRADAEDRQLARPVVLERVPRTGRDEDRVPRADAPRLAADLERAGTLRDEVDLLGTPVVVAVGRLGRLERGLGEALRGRVVQLADRRAVLRGKRLGALEVPEVHRAEARTSATRSCAPASIPVKNGSASDRELTSSATGQSPSPKPKRSRMYGCRWIDGR